MARERVFLNKMNLTLVYVLKNEWPHNWPEFIDEIVQASTTNEVGSPAVVLLSVACSFLLTSRVFMSISTLPTRVFSFRGTEKRVPFLFPIVLHFRCRCCAKTT